MKWYEIENIHELPDGIAILKVGKLLFFGEFSENMFWVYPNTHDIHDENWQYHFSSGQKYFYFPIQVH